MEYLFLKRKEVSSTSQRQKNLLFKAVEKHWEEEFVMKGRSNREIDSLDLQESALPVGDKEGVFGFRIVSEKVECYD